MKTKNFILKAENIHKNKYDYSKVNYINAKTKIKITCFIHGEFEQQPTNHLSGNGCPKCAGKNKTTEEFINEAKLIHGGKYDYSLIDYKNSLDKLIIKCELHGVFKQSASGHLQGFGCPKCVGKNKTTEEFINEAKLIHGNKYDYSSVDFKKTNFNVNIKCKLHGIFIQRANHHLSGSGCPKCAGKNKTTEEFINEAKLIHNNKYNYFLVKYISEKNKINIICPKHGEFKQKAGDHIRGRGCPICRESKGEREIRLWLENKNIKFIPQHKFKDCKDIRPLPFDFYLPDYKMCIEFQGRQHYEKVSIFGGEKELKKRQKRDKIKMEYCKDYNIPLIIIKYDDLVIEKLNTLVSSFQSLN